MKFSKILLTITAFMLLYLILLFLIVSGKFNGIQSVHFNNLDLLGNFINNTLTPILAIGSSIGIAYKYFQDKEEERQKELTIREQLTKDKDEERKKELILNEQKIKDKEEEQIKIEKKKYVDQFGVALLSLPLYLKELKYSDGSKTYLGKEYLNILIDSLNIYSEREAVFNDSSLNSLEQNDKYEKIKQKYINKIIVDSTTMIREVDHLYFKFKEVFYKMKKAEAEDNYIMLINNIDIEFYKLLRSAIESPRMPIIKNEEIENCIYNLIGIN